MVGLSVVLEPQKGTTSIVSNKSPLINRIINLNKTTPPSPSSTASFRSSSSSPTSFLDKCFLCKQKLLPSKDIYMYKGDRGFCSVECRCRQIFMDEEESRADSAKRDKCSFAAMRPGPTSSSSPSSRFRKGIRNRSNGSTAY